MIWFLVLILVPDDEVPSFHNEAHIFLSKKLDISLLTLPVGVLWKSEIIIWCLDNMSILISIISGAKG